MHSRFGPRSSQSAPPSSPTSPPPPRPRRLSLPTSLLSPPRGDAAFLNDGFLLTELPLGGTGARSTSADAESAPNLSSHLQTSLIGSPTGLPPPTYPHRAVRVQNEVSDGEDAVYQLGQRLQQVHVAPRDTPTLRPGEATYQEYIRKLFSNGVLAIEKLESASGGDYCFPIEASIALGIELCTLDFISSLTVHCIAKSVVA